MTTQILASIKNVLNTDEQKIFTLFFEPNFSGSWLFVSKEIICEHIGYADTRSWQLDFYNRIITKYLTLDVDYCIVSHDNPIITEYFRSALMLTEVKAPKQVHNKTYYIITGDAFQSICFRKCAVSSRHSQ